MRGVCSLLMVTPNIELPPSARPIDTILQGKGTTLKDFLAEHQARGMGYEAIAQELYLTTDRAASVSYQTIRRWLIEFDLLEVAS